MEGKNSLGVFLMLAIEIVQVKGAIIILQIERTMKKPACMPWVMLIFKPIHQKIMILRGTYPKKVLTKTNKAIWLNVLGSVEKSTSVAACNTVSALMPKVRWTELIL